MVRRLADGAQGWETEVRSLSDPSFFFSIFRAPLFPFAVQPHIYWEFQLISVANENEMERICIACKLSAFEAYRKLDARWRLV